ncbi:hypothetical protein N0V91_007508 [Didymella pomorum]|uniref:Uncharacterized protein n=1 Tax=Didymella pomorum TaxID=749634 RepID=A0A9W9D587_9PLEO|nr:hypothetical protein N0V91_007508 [Didymella pomorum]
MIFQRRFHSHTPTSIDSPPTPPPKDNATPAKTLEEILAIAVSPRAPKPPPHAAGTVASNPRIIKTTPLRSASSPLNSSVPKRAPSRKTGHATIHTDPVGGHDAFESDAFAVHMPTTRIPILDAPVSRPKGREATRAQVEAVRTYKEKAEQARKRNNSVGVRVPDNIASYDYAYASSPRPDAAIPAVLKPSNSPPKLAGAFPASPPAVQHKWTSRPEPVIPKSKISSNTSVFRKPTVLGVTTSAAVLEESVAYVRADAQTGMRSVTMPARSTTVKISMNPKTKTPSPPVSPTGPPIKVSALPAVKVKSCEPGSSQHAHYAGRCHAERCPVEHCRGTYYRAPYVETRENQDRRSPSPTKTMPNFTRQYSLEGDSIFGYRVRDRDPLGTVAGADKSASNSDEEKPTGAASLGKVRPPAAIDSKSKRLEELRKAQNKPKATEQKRTLADRWPWIRRDAQAGKSGGIGEPPKTRAPDPPVKAPVRAPILVQPKSKRPVSTYVSPFDAIATPPITPPRLVKPTGAAARATTSHAEASKKPSPVVSEASLSLEAGIKQIQDLAVLSVKVGLALYIVVALWFVLDAVREALCVVCVPLQYVLLFVWAVVGSVGRGLGTIAGGVGGKVRVTGR